MKVKFMPQDVEYEIKPGEPVLHVAQDHGIYVKSVCKGVPNCAECRVRIIDGEHNVLPPGTEELSLIGSGYFIDRRRLSCQLKCFGDIVVDMTEQIQKEQGLIGGRKSKKMQVKDDRVEAVVARRSEDSEPREPGEGGGEEMAEAEADASPAPQQRERRPQQQQQSRPQGQQNQQRRHEPRPPRAEGQGGGSQPRPEGGGEGGGKRRRRRRGGKGRGGGGGGGGGGAPPPS